MKHKPKVVNIPNRTKQSKLKRKNKKYNILVGKLKIVKYLRNELETSTTHGLSYTVNNKIHSLEKIFWITSFIICFGIVFLLLNKQYSRFMDAPTVMSVEMNYFDWNISYPAITLCPLHKPNVERFQSFIDHMNATNNLTGLDVDSYMWAISQSALDTLEYLDLAIPDDVIALIHPKDYATVAASVFRKFEDSWLTTNMNLSIGAEAAMTEMGMCHVINSNVAKYDTPEKRKNHDQSYVKNNIELSVFEADFHIELANYAPVYKVFIHSPDEITTSTTSTFIFDVEGVITFGLSVWSSRISEELRYKSLRLRKCRFIDEPTDDRYPIYSYSHCVLECRIKMIQKLCGCVPHFYRPLEHERTCFVYELKCVLYYRKEIIALEASEEVLKKFNYVEGLPRISHDCGCLNSCELDIYYKDNEDYISGSKMNKLIVKITSFPKVRVVRDIIFDYYDILLRSGGVVNLCIGSSIMSIMEFCLILIKVFIYLIVKAIITLLELI